MNNSYTPIHLSKSKTEGQYAVTLIAAGQVRQRNGAPAPWTIPPQTLQAAVNIGKFNELACFIDHTHGDETPSLKNLCGVISNPHFDGSNIHATLRLYNRPDLVWVRTLLDTIATDFKAGNPIPDVGLSLSFFGRHTVHNDQKITSEITHVESCDLVFGPAAKGRINSILSRENIEMPKSKDTSLLEEVQEQLQTQPPASNSDDHLKDITARVDQLTALVTDHAQAERTQAVEQLSQQVEQLTAILTEKEAATAIKGMGTPPADTGIHSVNSPLDRFSKIIDWLMGVPNAPVPEPQYRKADMIYFALTGDAEFRGVFDPNRVQLAAATTTTLPDMAVNAMNKVIAVQFSNLSAWRWYERITAITPNNGSLNALQLISFGGISNLPTVAEGGAYTELSVDDVKETASFVKKGGYIGITREMLKNSDIQRIQAVPKALAIAAIRTRSAAVSNIFTQAAGVGPTLSQDAVALFNVAHNNVAATAFSQAAWQAARTECFKHAEIQSGKALGVFPKYALVPADLYDSALSTFGYGEGMPTTYTPEAQDRGFADPRPIPLAVPDWTDANDWAYIVDPLVYPVLHISYSQQPGGGTHPTPELYTVVSETSGLMFTNDVLPIKVRDEWAIGVNGPRGIGKRNVV